MGRTAAVTYEEFETVAKAMTASGETPTARAMLLHFGKGSMTTFQKMADKFNSQQTMQTERVMSPAFVRAVFQYVDEESTRIYNQLKEEIIEARAARDEANAAFDRQAAELETCRAQVDEYKTANEQLKGRNEQLQTQVTEGQRELERVRADGSNARIELEKRVAVLVAQNEALEHRLARTAQPAPSSADGAAEAPSSKHSGGRADRSGPDPASGGKAKKRGRRPAPEPAAYQGPTLFDDTE